MAGTVGTVGLVSMETLRARAALSRSIRAFFDGRGYLETDTPLLAPDLIPEACLEVFKTRLEPPPNSVRGAAKDYWLVPSPEIWMKKLLAAHRADIYQLCRCFRNCEPPSPAHSREFTMLEYYTIDADYLDSLAVTEALFERLLADAGPTDAALRKTLTPPFVRWTMDEAFRRLAGFSLLEALERGSLRSEARRLGLDPPADADDGGIYNLIFVHAVEPALPKEKPVALLDYPAAVPCLARLSARNAAARERWELYAHGIELANCYSEETDAEAVRQFFLSEKAAKERSAVVPHAVDADYWKMFMPPADRADGAGADVAPGFPRCSGVALGFDRLVMAFTGHKSINAVLPFAQSN
jgi:lysyl-tRNA synthetase class 2